MSNNNNTLLMITESELTIFSKRNPEYTTFKRVYFNDGTLAGYLAYKE